MYQDPLIYTYFREAVENEDITALEAFADKNFFENLNDAEKQDLAHLFLKRANVLLASPQNSDEVETRLSELIHFTESIALQSGPIYCEIAEIFYRFSIFFNKERYLFCAIDRLKKAKMFDSAFFNDTPAWWHLWAKALGALGHYVQDPTFFERAIAKYQQAAHYISAYNILEARDLYWGWAATWVQIGMQSGELADYQRGLELFQKAHELIPDYVTSYQQGLFHVKTVDIRLEGQPTENTCIEDQALGCNHAHFQVEYGEARIFYGLLRGDPQILLLAQENFKKALTDRYLSKHNPPNVRDRAWIHYATTFKNLFCLTGDLNYFQQADSAFQEAIIEIPHQADLWLLWGELYLIAGWRDKDVQKIETALEKLTASKVRESNPLRLSALLGRAIVMLGFLIEDLELLNEGKKRILSALDVAPTDGALFFSAGIMHFCFGLYFTEPKEFMYAIDFFERGLEKDSTAVENWYEIFQTNLVWGRLKKDPKRIRKSLEIIERIALLRPHYPNYFNDWGIALIQLRVTEPSRQLHQALIEEALDKFERAASLRDDIEFIYNKACALLRLGDLLEDVKILEQSRVILESVYQKFPQDNQVRYHLALACRLLGEIDTNLNFLNEAIFHFEQLIMQNKEDETVLFDLGYTFLIVSELMDNVTCERGLEYKSQAEFQLIRALELGNTQAYYYLACLYSLSGRLEAALDFLKRAEKAKDLPEIEDLEHDEWLVKVRELENYQEFIASIKFIRGSSG